MCTTRPTRFLAGVASPSLQDETRWAAGQHRVAAGLSSFEQVGCGERAGDQSGSGLRRDHRCQTSRLLQKVAFMETTIDRLHEAKGVRESNRLQTCEMEWPGDGTDAVMFLDLSFGKAGLGVPLYRYDKARSLFGLTAIGRKSDIME